MTLEKQSPASLDKQIIRYHKSYIMVLLANWSLLFNVWCLLLACCYMICMIVRLLLNLLNNLFSIQWQPLLHMFECVSSHAPEVEIHTVLCVNVSQWVSRLISVTDWCHDPGCFPCIHPMSADIQTTTEQIIYRVERKKQDISYKPLNISSNRITGGN